MSKRGYSQAFQSQSTQHMTQAVYAQQARRAGYGRVLNPVAIARQREGQRRQRQLALPMHTQNRTVIPMRLKTSFGGQSVAEKITFVAELGTFLNSSPGLLFFGVDGYYSSLGQGIGNPVTNFIPYPHAEFNKLGSAYQQYTVVGLEVNFVPSRYPTINQNAASDREGAPYMTVMPKGVNDFITFTGTQLTQNWGAELVKHDKPKLMYKCEKTKRYVNMGYYVDLAAPKKYLRTQITYSGGGGINREMFTRDEAQAGVPLTGTQLPYICVYDPGYPDITNLSLGLVHVSVYYVFTNKNI